MKATISSFTVVRSSGMGDMLGKARKAILYAVPKFGASEPETGWCLSLKSESHQDKGVRGICSGLWQASSLIIRVKSPHFFERAEGSPLTHSLLGRSFAPPEERLRSEPALSLSK